MNVCKYLMTGFLGMVLTSGLFAQDNKKPNILFVFADDLTFESLQTLNNSETITPNLDRLRNRGVTFTHAFNQGSWTPAVCAASRAMMNTGSYLWKAAQYCNSAQSKRPSEMPACPVQKKAPKGYLSEFMKAAGYDTYFTGKWHVEIDSHKVFDVVGTVRGGMPNQTEARYNRKFIKGQPDTWDPTDKSNGGYWKGGKHWSEVVRDETLGFMDIAKKKSNPFFMYIAFNAVHDPRQAPQEYEDMYKAEDLSIPKSFLPEYPYCEQAGTGHNLRDERLAPYPRTKYSVQVNRKEYYALLTHMDHQIGIILDSLKAIGEEDNTYILFTADHGLALGDHGFIGKQNMYDRSMRVPLFVVGPGIKAGKIIDDKVYLQDIMATALDIAESDAVNDMDFKSLLPVCEGKKNIAAQDVVYGAYMGYQRMVRTDKYKMIIYPIANVVRLYNIHNDPDEMNDIAGMKYKKVMDKLFFQFKELQKEVKDPLDVTVYYNNYFKSLKN